MFNAYRHASRHAADLYRQMDVETAVPSADPHRLVVLLYDGAIGAIAQARTKADQPSERGTLVSRAIRIIDEGLKAAVNDDAGELSENLRALYDYMQQRLLIGNAHRDDAALGEVATLVADLRDAWLAIAPVKEIGGRLSVQG